jgi:hypothetical protein
MVFQLNATKTFYKLNSTTLARSEISLALNTQTSPLKFQDSEGGGRRSIVCHNEDLARKDRSDRQAIAAAVEERLIR